MSARPQCLGGSFVLCFIEVVTPVAFQLNFPERGSCLGRFRNDQRLWILVCQIAVHIEIREVGCRADQRIRRRDRLGIAGFATLARFHNDAPGDQPVFKHTPGKRFIEILRNRGSQQNQIRIHNMRDLMNCAVFLLR